MENCEFDRLEGSSDPGVFVCKTHGQTDVGCYQAEIGRLHGVIRGIGDRNAARCEEWAKTADEEREAKEAALRQLRLAQEVIAHAVDWGQIEPHAEDDRCPGDDTCECKYAAEVGEAMKGFIEKL